MKKPNLRDATLDEKTTDKITHSTIINNTHVTVTIAITNFETQYKQGDIAAPHMTASMYGPPQTIETIDSIIISVENLNINLIETLQLDEQAARILLDLLLKVLKLNPPFSVPHY